MNPRTTSFRAWTRCTCKCLSLLVLVVVVAVDSRDLQGEETAGSRWSTADPPTPASLGPMPSVSPPIRPGASESDASDATDNGLRRLPPVEDTSPVEEPNETPSVTEHPTSAQASVEPAPVDWSTPRVVVGPEVAARQVSHEEMVSASAVPQGQVSRFSQMAEGIMPSDAASSRAPTTSRYAEAADSGMTPGGMARQPVFARVFDETIPAAETAPETASETTPEPVADAAETPEPSAPLGTPEASGTLSPIFACRLLGLPALSETRRAAEPDEATISR